MEHKPTIAAKPVAAEEFDVQIIPLPSQMIAAHKPDIEITPLTKLSVLAGIAVLIALIAFQPNWIARGKMAFVEMCAFIILLSLAVVFKFHDLMGVLTLLEKLADLARDEAMIQLQAQQHRLAEFNAKFIQKEQDEHPGLRDLLQKAGPIAMLFLGRERSVIKWGLAGAKFVKQAYDVWKAKS